MQAVMTKHPSSLRTFFATEMWERYGFYVVQTLLALYLALHFKWQDKNVYELVGSFTALTYVAPLIGGWIADHLLGQKRAILSGAVILLFSYLALALSSSNQQLTLCLASIAVGTGLLKPNISSLLGNEYPDNSPKRESGFTIFYMGITTGIILGSTLPGYLRFHYGWSLSFLSAAIGMLFAIIVFIYGVYKYHIRDYHPYTHQMKKVFLAIIIMLLQWSSAYYILNSPKIADVVFGAVVLMCILYLIGCIKYEPSSQAKQTCVIALLCVISVLFWSLYFQMFLSLILFLLRVVEPKLWGMQFPPPYYVGVESIGMLIFGAMLARQKIKQTKKHPGIRTGNQFLLAMILTTISYALIVLACRLNMNPIMLSPLYIIPAYLMIALAELLLSPVGLSAITVLASRRKVSTMMGIFFVSLGIGGFLAGKLAKLTVVAQDNLSILDLKIHYAQAFTKLLYLSLTATVFCIFLNGLIQYLMKHNPPAS